MNKDRRKAIVLAAVELAKAKEIIESVKDDLETLRDEEQEYYENMPEAFQYADKGYAAEEAITAFNEAIEVLDGIDFDSIDSYLDDAGQ
jgi:uncharacterized coiled-coil DUF342 family protein